MGIKEDADGPSPLNPLTGNFCIESIQLMDGGTLLDQVLEASILQGFRNYKKTNDENTSIQNNLTKNNLGFVLSGVTTFDGQTPKLPNRNTLKMDAENGPSEVGSELADTSWLSLKELLPFLSSSLYVPTDVFKNLKIVINWKNPSQLKNLVKTQNQNYSTLEETALVVDEVSEGEAKNKMMSSYQGVSFKAIESDRVVVPSITGIPADGTKEQQNRFLTNAFNNKSVERMVVVQTPTEDFVTGNDLKGAGNQASQAQFRSSFQLRINGANHLSRDGLTRKNQRLATLTQSWGECNLIPGSNNVYNEDLVTNNVAQGKEAQNLMGQFDYIACNVNKSIQEMVVEYNRTGVDGNADLNQQLLLNIFCEVNKAVSVENKKYTVSYI